MLNPRLATVSVCRYQSLLDECDGGNCSLNVENDSIAACHDEFAKKTLEKEAVNKLTFLNKSRVNLFLFSFSPLLQAKACL